MVIPQDVEQKAGNWFLNQELPQLLRTGAAFAAGHLTSGNMAGVLAHWGITIDPHKFSASLETWGVGIAAAVLAHYGVRLVGVQVPSRPLTPQGGQPTPAGVDPGTPPQPPK